MSNNEKLLDELRRLHNDLLHGSDGGCFDICGLVGQAAERIEGLERQLEAAVVRGEWEFVTAWISICTACGEEIDINYDDEYAFCPNCGAKMREEVGG